MDIEQIKCRICLKMLCQPISMPCGHNFCKLCINEIIQKSIYRPRCPICSQKIICEFEVNKLLESALKQNWETLYKTRLKEPGYKKDINIQDLWTMSIIKTTRTILVLVLPVCVIALLHKHVRCFPTIVLKIIRIAIKVTSYKSTSCIWQILWSIMHMIVKYLEATSVLSNIYN